MLLPEDEKVELNSSYPMQCKWTAAEDLLLVVPSPIITIFST
jgi:hypothetical protein